MIKDKENGIMESQFWQTRFRGLCFEPYADF